MPSGQPVAFQDLILDETGAAGMTARFRFVTPEIARDGGSIGFDRAEGDMLALCEIFALPRIHDMTPAPDQIVISLSDRPVTFGTAAPEATQFFEAYRPEGGACVWEGF